MQKQLSSIAYNFFRIVELAPSKVQCTCSKAPYPIITSIRQAGRQEMKGDGWNDKTPIETMERKEKKEI